MTDPRISCSATAWRDYGGRGAASPCGAWGVEGSGHGSGHAVLSVEMRKLAEQPGSPGSSRLTNRPPRPVFSTRAVQVPRRSSPTPRTSSTLFCPVPGSTFPSFPRKWEPREPVSLSEAEAPTFVGARERRRTRHPVGSQDPCLSLSLAWQTVCRARRDIGIALHCCPRSGMDPESSSG